MKWFGVRKEPVASHEVRAAREAAGWTHEQVADAMGVLPVEVSAWESGALPLGAYEAAVMRWRIDVARYEDGLRADCDWARANQARQERLRRGTPLLAVRAERERAEHARTCPECLRVEALRRELPAPPDPPGEPGFMGGLRALRRRIARLPAWLRLPAQVAEGAIVVAAAYPAYLLMKWLEGSDPGPASLRGMMLVAGGLAWFQHLRQLLDPLAERRPWLAGQLLAAGVAFPAAAALGLMGYGDLASFGPWFAAGLISVVGGGVLGKVAVQELMDDPACGTPDEEERDVFIPQQPHYFKP